MSQVNSPNKVQRLKHVSALKEKNNKQLKRHTAQRLQVSAIFLQRALRMQKKELILLAAQMYLDILNFHPRCIEAYIGLSRIEFHFGQLDNSLMLINQARKINPKNKSLYVLMQKVRQAIDNEYNNCHPQHEPTEKLSPQIKPAAKKKQPPQVFNSEQLSFPTKKYHCSTKINQQKKVETDIKKASVKKIPVKKNKSNQVVKSITFAKQEKINQKQIEPTGFSILNI